MDYYVKYIEDITPNKISEFEESFADGKKKYSRLIIDEGYRQKIWYPFAKFSIVFERTKQSYKEITLTEFKKMYKFLPVITKYYDKYRDTKEMVKIQLDDSETIFIKAQSMKDLYLPNYDGSHCRQYYRLSSFIISPRDECN